MIRGILLGDRVVAEGKPAQEIYENNYFGDMKKNHVELSLLEAAFLIEDGKLEVRDSKKLDFTKFVEHCTNIDPRFKSKYIVFKDLRSKNFPTKSGFKFGCDFRVYEKGVKPIKRGPKSAKEHTKWIVYSVPEDFECSFQELSRAVRLAHNIRANMLWALIGQNEKVSYYQVTFFKP